MNGGEERAVINRKVSSRLDKFSSFFEPYIHHLVLDTYRFFYKVMDAGNILFPADLAVCVKLADLPRGTKRPRLYITNTFVAELSEKEKQQYVRGKPLERGYQYARYFLEYEAHSCENGTISSHYRFQYRVDHHELGRLKRTPKKVYEENVLEHQGAINGVARGENQQFYKIIKKILKEKSSLAIS